MNKVKVWCVLFFILGISHSGFLQADSGYVLDAETSVVQFISSKQTHIFENHHFTSLSGSISENSEATLVIKLDSVETGIEIRNERVRELLFEVASHHNAVIKLPVNLSELNKQIIGTSQKKDVLASLNLHGVTADIDTQLVVTKLSESKIMVQNAYPVLIKAGDYKLTAGIDSLKNIANLDVISYTVPVNFTLIFKSL